MRFKFFIAALICFVIIFPVVGEKFTQDDDILSDQDWTYLL